MATTELVEVTHPDLPHLKHKVRPVMARVLAKSGWRTAEQLAAEQKAAAEQDAAAGDGDQAPAEAEKKSTTTRPAKVADASKEK